MRKMGFTIAVVLVLVSSDRAHAQRTQTLPTVNYAAYMQQDHDGRLRTFNRITPENRTALVREHIQRWMDVNRGSLTPEQRSVLEDWLAFASPEFSTPYNRTIHSRQEGRVGGSGGRAFFTSPAPSGALHKHSGLRHATALTPSWFSHTLLIV